MMARSCVPRMAGSSFPIVVAGSSWTSRCPTKGSPTAGQLREQPHGGAIAGAAVVGQHHHTETSFRHDASKGAEPSCATVVPQRHARSARHPNPSQTDAEAPAAVPFRLAKLDCLAKR